jgi:hypothetical protein
VTNGRVNPWSISSGEHTRPRVSQSAPSPTASAHAMGSGEDAGMWPAGAPATTREARVLPGGRRSIVGEDGRSNVRLDVAFQLWRCGMREAKVQNMTIQLTDSFGALGLGEHTRPRVSQLAPSPTASAHTIGNGEDAGMWPAGAPATTRETEQHKRGPRGGLGARAPRRQTIHRWRGRAI